MKPSAIQQSIRATRLLYNHEPYGAPESLLIAWVAWEQLKNRILYVGLTKQGWDGKTIDEAIRGVEFWKKGNFDRAFETVFGKRPHQLSLTAEVWKMAEEGLPLRNKFVHGMGQESPTKMGRYTRNLLEVLEDTTWCHELEIMTSDGRVTRLGNPLSRVGAKSNRQRIQSAAKLREQLGLRSTGK